MSLIGSVGWRRSNMFDGWEASWEAAGQPDVAFTIQKAGKAYCWEAHDMNEDLGTVSFMAGHERTLKLAMHAAEIAANDVLGKPRGAP